MLTADTPLRPSDIYGAHKVEAENLVRASGLDWVILRLGGVLTAEPRLDVDLDTIYFEASLPVDGRIQTVDVRDVARAFIAATTAPVVGETLLIGGDESHRLVQGDIAAVHRGGDGPGRRDSGRTKRQPGQRRRLVRHRLDGHHTVGGSP